MGDRPAQARRLVQGGVLWTLPHGPRPPARPARRCATMAEMSDVEPVVVLAHDEARLVLHVLAVFERVLRLGALEPRQLRLLVPDGLTAAFERADVEMAEVVVEAGEPLRRQLM